MRQKLYRPVFHYSFLHPKFWGVWLALGAVRLCAFLPHRLVCAAGASLGGVFCAVNKKRRAIAEANLALCFPEQSEAWRRQLLREHFRAYGRALLSMGLLWWGGGRRLDRLVRCSGVDRLEQTARAGRKVILLAAHTVTVDFTGIILSRIGLTVGMMKPLKNPLLNWAVCRGRQRHGAQLVPREQGLARLVRTLRAPECRFAYYIPDEDFGAEQSVFVPFFSVPAATLPTLGRMARLADALVVPVFARLAADGSYELTVHDALQNFPGDDETENAARMNRALEKTIRTAPEQYMWTLRWFKTRPPGEMPPYP
ncbi:MAG: lysophospholipid acyltransferase family protein [Gammaproteobacteria bacterium]|nr:lysophospholipid acyltransferase family protein [Gammaproteobacteria bacterium]MDD9850180.1 lysophospholipid acyltransferase family protein [Gammaproteobacteria bacterium]